MVRFNLLGFASRSLSLSQRFRNQCFHNQRLGVLELQHILHIPQNLYTCCSSINGIPPHDVSSLNLSSMKRYFHATGACYSMQQDMYKVLGVSKSASRDDIRKAFLALAKKYHPDANKDNPVAKRKFQEIREAYETLRDPEKRAQYDEMEHRGAAQKEWGAGQTSYATREAEDVSDAYGVHFNDAFRKIFSEVFEHETEEVAVDIQADLKLTFSEAAQGCTKHLSFEARIPCDSCNGFGYPIGAKPKVCPTCRGAGKVTVLPFTSTCGTCKGFGRIIKEKCTACRGHGVINGTKEVKVTIPGGVEPGDTIRVPKAGHSGGRGVQPGNLCIKLKVSKDPIFHREGADIYVDAQISLTQAILGGSIDVPTLSGKMQVKIPNGVQPGQQLVLRGRGLSKLGSFLTSHGDLYVRFRVNVPTSLNDRQRALLEEFAQEEWSHENSTSGGTWWQQTNDQWQQFKAQLEQIQQMVNQSPTLKFSFIVIFLFLLGRSL
ncbi:hypothetical protein ACHQM5_023757 [Ranunculus cassubicifolius]